MIVLLSFVVIACGKDDSSIDDIADQPIVGNDGMDSTVNEQPVGDTNKDGSLNILLLGSSKSINSAVSAFSLEQVRDQLEAILAADTEITEALQVVYEDIYRTSEQSVGLGSSGNQYPYDFYAHSLLQYYYWPDGKQDRMENLKGNQALDWDYVIIAADPYIVSKTPGFYALGVNKIADKVSEGGGHPLLLLDWPKEEDKTAPIASFEEIIYRTAMGARANIKVVSSGLAWENLPSELKDVSDNHPSPNGAYLTASSIYATIYDKNATSSDYVFNNAIADAAFESVKDAASQPHFSGDFNFNSPFQGVNINASIIRYNHTGTSSENGIISGLKWVIDQDDQITLERDGAPTVHFNIGRANTNFEAGKRYKVNPDLFDYSLGFPMQDHSNTGNVSMLYGIDKRRSESENGTDLGVALYMIRQNELPTARAIPIRSLYAQMKELGVAESAYRDGWHMSRNLDRASGSYIYTLLTGKCNLGQEPTDDTTDEWRRWGAHKIGYETAWTLRSLQGKAPDCN